MSREIKFSLVYRDMWQSSGKYVPRVDQLTKVAPHIVDMGCFSRVETNGGGFEQINLLFGENPNKAVRAWTKPFKDAGIQTHMLERSLNGIRMSPCSEELRKMIFRLKKKQGTDIARSFCGLNDPRNLERSIRFAKEGGMIAQASLSITFSPVHTVEYYVDLANHLIDVGADEICIKDMAGIGRPESLGKIVKGIKAKNPQTIIQYHAHSGPGFAPASILEVARAGVEYIDVGMEPLSWGTGHVDLITAHEMLKDAGFIVPDINMNAYMEVRRLTQEFIDDFLGLYINPKNRFMNSLLIGPGLPGGMMGSLMADLENNLSSINKWLSKRDQPTLTQDELLIKLFDEVKFIWPKLGYPPLVTPYSQYVKNTALMNVMQLIKGKERWTLIDDNTWDMLLGKSGKLPGEVADEIKALAYAQERHFFDGDPQEFHDKQLGDELEKASDEMLKNKWEFGEDNEELFEFAMHPAQYRAYKSGEAKAAFVDDVAKRKSKTEDQPVVVSNNVVEDRPQHLNITVDGQSFDVKIGYGQKEVGDHQQKLVPAKVEATKEIGQSVQAPLEGKFFLTKTSSEEPKKIGDEVKEGDIIGYIESMKVYNAIAADKSGVIQEICHHDGEDVEEDENLMILQ
ncbi:oxaloacetate decarboxylase [Flammeovirga yaeyamensis]|uniref:Oxaloacetate decarboxylase n=1 Tax=Flammeovirga yaeyamensis TaxID=367791 RepID=A0AAX1N216_9BACT|nr:biotin/lipoyl-containing protein [Flammeovirga yaeyamensis]MBB3701544.1 pyruvate carboxylase subunit B [Flammeovirga yaeyamensis]NMF38688.1 oxaloacetate decarboxylase [Flammeovirga yaeyamensis]QWG01554.1 oxaloacetate decarboxylase [Flammeovirga yaeyamensis]